MDILFKSGTFAGSYPIRSVYIETNEPQPFPVRVMFVVPKRNFRNAWERNHLKRRMREVYRLHKPAMYAKLESGGKKFSLAFIYTGKKKEEYKEIERSMLKLINVLTK